MSQIVVCAMYKFVTLNNFQDIRQPILDLMIKNNVKGTIILANEGINGTVAGSRKGIDKLLKYLKYDVRIDNINYRESYYEKIPFYRSKVKLKKEIVTLGIDGINPNKLSGQYVKPKDWNKLISKPETILIDTRNDYEISIGTFKNAINPQTVNFREFPKYVNKNLDPKKHKKIAMFCTGGIRCEKSTSLMKEKGFDEVYHLQGGILRYLEEVQKKESMWEGDCFVFDSRVAVNHNLGKGNYDQCFACRMPITNKDKERIEYLKGISCHNCYNKITEDQKSRFTERKKQIQLAAEKGFYHIGDEAKKLTKINNLKKQKAKNSKQSNNIISTY